jgi:type VI secretion system secreted protein VgrG
MYVHTNRPMKLTTPLGKDALILTGFSGHEGLSELFRYQLDTLWEDKNKPVAFDQLLGQKVTVEIAATKGVRYFNGIVSKLTQEERDNREFTHYRLEVVPQLWLWRRNQQSRIFQHLSIPDILKKVLKGLDVSYEIQGTFEQREYCVQYRETDFAFASRLMEEEGIYYFFKHSKDGHQLVLANTPQSHVDIPYQPKVVYEEMTGHTVDEERVFGWNKVQRIRSGKCLTWDSTFQMPGKHLEAEKTILDSVAVGKTVHKLSVANSKLEIYDYPGEYAGRFDGIDKGGGEQSSKLQKIFTDNQRTVGIRMQQEALPSLAIHARGEHAGFTAGHTFQLTKHFSDDGKFVLTRVEHKAEQPMEVDDTEEAFHYKNRFSCIPVALPFQPERRTPVPSIQGTQTAVVVGPAGEEIFTDKYGRVKVQFFWDRDGKNDANSSCWVRVATHWAGKQWGAIHIPRIGQEVIVDFMEGDVNNPIIVGSVYNADMMPPYDLPDNKTQSGIKSRSSKGGSPANFNEIRFEDKKGSEQVFIHAEKNQDIEVENDETHWVGHDRKKTIDHDETTHVKHDRTETVDHDETITIHGKETNTIDGNQSIEITQGNQSTSIDLGKIETEAMQSIELKVGQSSIKLDPTGVTIKGMMITIEAQVQGQFKAVMIQVNGSAMTQVQGGLVMIN